MKRIYLIFTILLMILLSVSCMKEDDENTIRYLNFKPEIAGVYEEIANVYEEETGVKLIVETAASGSYESTLQARMSTSDAPTIFQINGPVGYKSWKNYCADLTDSELYKHLTDKDLAIKADGKVYGIPYVVEGYGIIYNKEITDAYFNSSWKNTSYKSMDEVNNFTKFKEVVEDMQANKDKLGINGVFASTSLKTGEDWRWQTHLANIPISYEFTNNNVDLNSDAYKEVSFQYSENYKNIFDLYLENSVTNKTQLGTFTVSDSMSEFALGKCVMVQNGNWGAGQILNVNGNKVKEENIKFMPIYTNMEGEETQGLSIGTENFICVNSKASEEKQKLAKDFLYWLYSSEKGKNYVVNKLGFIAPFDTFTESDAPKDPLAKEVVSWMNKENIDNIAWNFTLFPSQNFKESFGGDLLKYAQGKTNWDTVVNNFKTNWKNEWKLVG